MGAKSIKDPVLRNILYLLWESGVTELEFCTALKINKSAVTDWKSGKTISYRRSLPKIAGYFKVSALDLTDRQLIAKRLAPEGEDGESGGDGSISDIATRLNEFQGFPLQVQEVGLEVMRGIAKRNAAGQ